MKTTAAHNEILPLAEQIIASMKVAAEARAKLGDTGVFGVNIQVDGGESRSFYESGDLEADAASIREFLADYAD